MSASSPSRNETKLGPENFGALSHTPHTKGGAVGLFTISEGLVTRPKTTSPAAIGRSMSSALRRGAHSFRENRGPGASTTRTGVTLAARNFRSSLRNDGWCVRKKYRDTRLIPKAVENLGTIRGGVGLLRGKLLSRALEPLENLWRSSGLTLNKEWSACVQRTRSGYTLVQVEKSAGKAV
jgi:hypothetical protein